MGQKFNVDLSNYRDTVGTHVEPGRYAVVIEDVQVEKSTKNNDMLVCIYRIVGGQFDGATLPLDRLAFRNADGTPSKALFRLVGLMTALGLKWQKKGLTLNTDMFLNKMLYVDVEDGDPYEGKVKSEVRGYLRYEKSEAVAPDTSADIEDLEEPAGFESADEGPVDYASPDEDEATLTREEADIEAMAGLDPDEPQEIDLESLNL